MINNRFIRGLLPTYTELSLLLMIFGVFLTIISDFETAKKSMIVLDGPDWIFNTIIILSIILTIYYAFNFKKTPGKTAKTFMLVIGILLELDAAFMLLIYSVEYLSIFSAILCSLNLMQAVSFVMLMKIGVVNESSISSRNASPAEIVIGLASMLLLFTFINQVLQLEFPITLSLMITYSVYFNNIVSAIYPDQSPL